MQCLFTKIAGLRKTNRSTSGLGAMLLALAMAGVGTTDVAFADDFFCPYILVFPQEGEAPAVWLGNVYPGSCNEQPYPALMYDKIPPTFAATTLCSTAVCKPIERGKDDAGGEGDEGNRKKYAGYPQPKKEVYDHNINKNKLWKVSHRDVATCELPGGTIHVEYFIVSNNEIPPKKFAVALEIVNLPLPATPTKKLQHIYPTENGVNKSFKFQVIDGEDIVNGVVSRVE